MLTPSSRILGLIWLLGLVVSALAAGQSTSVGALVEGPWVRPAARVPAQPMWGHAKGLRVGLAPLPGPRGLLRLYAPHLGLPESRAINFIAVEPVPAGIGRRALSELERSTLDGIPGKRFWSTDDPSDTTPRSPESPSRGVLITLDSAEALRVFIAIEPFDNGACVYLRLTFRTDRPDEVGIATFAQKPSRALDYCIITATMGNFTRLRRLYLKDAFVLAGDLWPIFRGDGFAAHRAFLLSDLFHTSGGDVLVPATPNEEAPATTQYAPGTPPGWKYQGPVATQYWRVEKPDPRLVAQVNGRLVYWASKAPIPGGVAYENFEMLVPYQDGREFWFGVTLKTPEQLGIGGR